MLAPRLLDSMGRPWVVGFLAMVLCFACSRRGATAAPRCFNVVVTDNSPGTRALFEARQCQGGGVTWAAILEVLVRKHGGSRADIDEEGDAVRFCSDSEQLLTQVRRDVSRLNANATELERTLSEADPDALECEALPARRRTLDTH